jgi:hypothetical protein
MDQKLTEKSTILLGALEDLGIENPDTGVLLKLIKLQADRIDVLEIELDELSNRVEDLENPEEE